MKLEAPFTLKVPAIYLALLRLFAAKSGQRDTLMSLCFEVGDRETRIVATDSVRLGVVRIRCGVPQFARPACFVVPLGLFLSVDPNRINAFDDVTVSFSPSAPDVVDVAVVYQSHTVSGSVMDCVYPYWQNSIPRTFSGEPALGGFDFSFVARLASFWQKLRGWTFFRLIENGDNPALLSLNDEDFVGVLATKRAPDNPVGNLAHNWVFEPLSGDAAATMAQAA